MKKIKYKVLYKFKSHPYIKLTQDGRYLTLEFQDSMSSYSKWYKIRFYWVNELQQLVKLEEEDD